MLIPRSIYFYLPAFLTECGLFCYLLAEPIHAINHLGASPMELGIMGMAQWGGYALVALLAGILSDRTGRRGWILVGAGSQVLCGLILPYCTHLWLFIFIAAVQTTLLGCFWAPFMGLFSESYPPAMLSGSLGRYNMSWCTGGMVGSLLSGLLYDRLGPWAPFWVGAGLMLASFLIVLLGHSERVAGIHAPHPGARPRTILFMKQAWLVLVSNFFVVNLIVYVFPKLAETPPLLISAEGISRLHGCASGGHAGDLFRDGAHGPLALPPVSHPCLLCLDGRS